jgi:hypothetical protein
MKNIHLLPTEKPSRLHITGKLMLYPNGLMPKSQGLCKNQHIYITSNEEIKEGDWCYDKLLNFIFKTDNYTNFNYVNQSDNVFKIILTTDQELNGVQAIDDSFLEWFVKNPSCEFVEWSSEKIEGSFDGEYWKFNYGTVIPQEEPNPFELPKALPDEVFYQSLEAKQETLEEAAENFANSKEWMNGGSSNWVQFSFKNGAKWQAERSYSKEEVLQIYKDYESYVIKTPITEVIEFSKWFEQFKKK